MLEIARKVCQRKVEKLDSASVTRPDGISVDQWMLPGGGYDRYLKNIDDRKVWWERWGMIDKELENIGSRIYIQPKNKMRQLLPAKTYLSKNLDINSTGEVAINT